MKSFRAEVRSAFPEWDRYAVYMTAVCFGAGGEMIDYVNLTGRDGVLETPPCERADLYLYIIAREFPASDVISASPPFEIEIVTRAGDAAPKITTYPVNQWGGLSVKLKVES
jgi:hypothetical protein